MFLKSPIPVGADPQEEGKEGEEAEEEGDEGGRAKRRGKGKGGTQPDRWKIARKIALLGNCLE